MKKQSAVRGAVMLAAAVVSLTTACHVQAQLAPGPHEMLPFQEGFIVEAFFDLQTNTTGQIADWTGFSGTTWVSPNAYNNHIGSDYSVQTGTPVYATTAGTVAEMYGSFPVNDHSTYYGNFVRIAVDGLSPLGEQIDVRYAHMLQVAVTNGQRVVAGTYVGLSDDTGNSTTEHVHFQSEYRGGLTTCPYYWGHYQYPIIFNTNATLQVGRIVKVVSASAPIRSGRFDTSSQISTAYANQLYFCSFPKRGYYQVFLPNNSSWRSAWIRSTDVQEVFTGTVIQPLADNTPYAALGQLATKYSIRATPSDTGTQIGQVLFGGSRFVADQITNGYYRIPVPGTNAVWGWVKPNNRMIVYPQLTKPDVNVAALPNTILPAADSFATLGKSYFGRAKFNRGVVKTFSPSSPGGDGKALFLTDATNFGDGTSDSVVVGTQAHTNTFVECDVYFNYRPSYLAKKSEYELSGLVLRDDGFAGLDTTFEGAGNSYGLVWNNYSGRLYAGKFVDGALTDFLPSTYTVATSGWHKLRIEGVGSQIKYYLDGVLLINKTDTTFHAGQCGIGYSQHVPGYPAARGVYFDNFSAGTL